MTVWNDAGFTHALASANWMASTAVLMHHNERATGDPARDWLSSWAHRYFVGNDLRVLVLGCGEGWLERALAERPYIAHIDAYDFAADAVERARETARAQGIDKIDYHVADLNVAQLQPDAYDVVIAHAVLHHLDQLEFAFEQIARAMRRDATLIVNEYVGPNRFQFSDDVLAIINELLACLPERYRRGVVEQRIYERRERPTVEQMIASDPTEAVRAVEISGMLAERFHVIERRDIGGTILQHLLYDIVQNFRFDDPRERSIIDLLCTIEAMLLDQRRISPDFVIYAACRKDSRPKRDDYARPLPPRPEAANDVEPDPLRLQTRVTGGRGSRLRRPLTRSMLRALRIALASTQSRRANLFDESRGVAMREQLRFLASRQSAEEWLVSRYTAVGDDPAIVALLRLLSRYTRAA